MWTASWVPSATGWRWRSRSFRSLSSVPWPRAKPRKCSSVRSWRISWKPARRAWAWPSRPLPRQSRRSHRRRPAPEVAPVPASRRRTRGRTCTRREPARTSARADRAGVVAGHRLKLTPVEPDPILLPVAGTNGFNVARTDSCDAAIVPFAICYLPSAALCARSAYVPCSDHRNPGRRRHRHRAGDHSFRHGERPADPGRVLPHPGHRAPGGRRGVGLAAVESQHGATAGRDAEGPRAGARADGLAGRAVGARGRQAVQRDQSHPGRPAGRGPGGRDGRPHRAGQVRPRRLRRAGRRNARGTLGRRDRAAQHDLPDRLDSRQPLSGRAGERGLQGAPRPRCLPDRRRVSRAAHCHLAVRLGPLRQPRRRAGEEVRRHQLADHPRRGGRAGRLARAGRRSRLGLLQAGGAQPAAQRGRAGRHDRGRRRVLRPDQYLRRPT